MASGLLPFQGAGQELHGPADQENTAVVKTPTLGNSGWYGLNGGLEISVVSEMPISRSGVCSG